MKLEGLQFFYNKLEHELSPDSILKGAYYFYEECWFELATQNPVSEIQCRDIERAKSEPIAYHASSSLDAWFYLGAFNAVVCLGFSKSPTKPTRKRALDRILNIQESAINAYKVSHNQLTQLLAREAFREKLTECIVGINKSQKSDIEMQGDELPRILAILALDIDHFKQVNDTWGHLYGDQVLKAFGRRLENCAEKIRLRGYGKADIFVGHPSGEEFLVIIEASATRDQFIDWANEFKNKIANEVLPSDKEWSWLTGSSGNSNQTLPQIQERTVTTSVGMAFYKNASGQASIGDSVSDILERADTALYRAKAAGRNQVISYDEILLHCGRVIEHDENTQVVALDIGTNVGVSVGQEFKVFLSKFSGKEKFVINDGRTKRTIGHYPRVESARIVVFNAQPELSFAYVDSPVSALLEAGSQLEAIPVGSIGHLLPSSSKYFNSVPNSIDGPGVEKMQNFLADANSKAPYAIVVRFAKGSEYLNRYGAVSLNAALAQLYRDALLNFHAAFAVELLDKDAICIVGNNAAYKEKILDDFVQSIASNLPELGVVAGVFCEADRKKSAAKDQAELKSENAIEFARFAAADAGRSPETRIRHFTYQVAYDVLNSLREKQSFDMAYADFNRLRSLGLESPSLLNLGGLISGSLGQAQQSLDYFAAAINKDPDYIVYKSNYGAVAYGLGEIDSALKILNGMSTDDVESLKSVHPYGYFCYARLLAKALLNGSPMFNGERFVYVARDALLMEQFKNAAGHSEIEKALQKC